MAETLEKVVNDIRRIQNAARDERVHRSARRGR